jgi:hypothetical protein
MSCEALSSARNIQDRIEKLTDCAPNTRSAIVGMVEMQIMGYAASSSTVMAADILEDVSRMIKAIPE